MLNEQFVCSFQYSQDSVGERSMHTKRRELSSFTYFKNQKTCYQRKYCENIKIDFRI